VTSKCLAFGADPYSVSMRDGNPVNLTAQLRDYGTLIRFEYMKMKYGDFLDPAKQGIIMQFNHARNEHETLRKLLKEIWLLNLSKCTIYDILFIVVLQIS
jgi:hypothetical protein